MPTDRRPRVAHVVPRLFGEEGAFGGAERYALELARAMARLVPTRLVAFGKNARGEACNGLDIRVERERWAVAGRRHDPVNAAFLRHCLWADVIHCHQYRTTSTAMALITAKATRKRTFVTDHGGGGSNLVRRLRAGRWFRAQLSQSEFAASTMPGIGRGKEIIYAGVDPDRYKPGPAKIPGRFVFLGRILPHKGVEHLIRGLPGDASLEVVGRAVDPDYFQFLKEISTGAPVSFSTSAADIEVIPKLASAQALVLPSVYTDYAGRRQELPELVGLVLLEAMACGTAVVCSKVGGMPEIVIEGETGFVVEPGSPEALRKSLVRFQLDPGLARRMGDRARTDVLARFTWDAVARRCLEAYRT